MPATRAILLAAALAELATSAAAQTFEQRCASEIQPNFTIRSVHSGYRVDNTVSTKVLVNRAMHARSGDMTLGLTSATSRVQVDMDGKMLVKEDGSKECLAPQIEIELRYLPLHVYVAREFSPSGCPYRTVLAHEMDHVRLYLEHLPKVEQRLRAALEEHYEMHPIVAPPGKALNVLYEQLDQWLWPMIKTEMRRVEQYQQDLDSHEEQFRLSMACNGEVAYNVKGRY
ncbi:MAG TPA: hypothetical protein VGF27_05625 [Pseudoduganella sp.]